MISRFLQTQSTNERSSDLKVFQRVKISIILLEFAISAHVIRSNMY